MGFQPAGSAAFGLPAGWASPPGFLAWSLCFLTLGFGDPLVLTFALGTSDQLCACGSQEL